MEKNWMTCACLSCTVRLCISIHVRCEWFLTNLKLSISKRGGNDCGSPGLWILHACKRVPRGCALEVEESGRSIAASRRRFDGNQSHAGNQWSFDQTGRFENLLGKGFSCSESSCPAEGSGDGRLYASAVTAHTDTVDGRASGKEIWGKPAKPKTWKPCQEITTTTVILFFPPWKFAYDFWGMFSVLRLTQSFERSAFLRGLKKRPHLHG